MHGVVIHHTAGTSSLALCYEGTSALPGPLCHTHLSKSGVATMVGHGRANHAGGFAENAHSAVLNESSTHPRPAKAEPVDGNRYYYGIEIENRGDGKDWYPAAQYDAAVRWAAAICRYHGWTADSVIGHKEGTTRKIDPRGPVGKKDGPAWDMDAFRADVAKRLTVRPATPAPKPTVKRIVSLAAVVFAATHSEAEERAYSKSLDDVRAVQHALIAEGRLAPGTYEGGIFDIPTKNAYAAYQRTLGYDGVDADGVPGESSLKRLGAKRGFTVVA
ncbi:N-acetylmuramoyl-L-alanine amidase [Streptomyces sp. DH12]|uniref:peptidoglycan recognition protein family protein n=1 Tax=Streptomyces sp. DH12 TaxID=2857010 RepID=UPI001E31D34A|nr:N-acetylmuramoyl-L-alanine amidase [Streptomyces sp. DH12]